MADDRRPLQGLLDYIQQIVGVTGRLQDFHEQPFFYILVRDSSGRSVLHIRSFQSERMPTRIIELGEGNIDEPVRTIRMRDDGMPVALDDFVRQTLYRVEREAHNWISRLKRDGYLQQAALSYTVVLSSDSKIWRPLPKSGLNVLVPGPVCEEHYVQRLQPQEGILLRKRVGPQPVAKAVRDQYLQMLEHFSSSGWFDTALIRSTIAARFGKAYFVLLSPVSCSTGWQIDRLSFPVSAFLLSMPPLLYKDGSFAANYTNERGAPFVNSHARHFARNELRRRTYDMLRERDLYFLYCPNCQGKVARSIDPPPYSCKHCKWEQIA